MRTNIDFQDVVLKLEVVPLINKDKEVSLTIAQVNDSVVGQQRVAEDTIPIIGGTGRALDDFDREGKIWLEGEAWSAQTKAPVKRDQAVLVTAMNGLVLEIEPLPDDDPHGAESPA